MAKKRRNKKKDLKREEIIHRWSIGVDHLDKIIHWIGVWGCLWIVFTKTSFTIIADWKLDITILTLIPAFIIYSIIRSIMLKKSVANMSPELKKLYKEMCKILNIDSNTESEEDET